LPYSCPLVIVTLALGIVDLAGLQSPIGRRVPVAALSPPSAVLRHVSGTDVACGVVRLASRAAGQAFAHLPDQAVDDRPEVAARPGGHRPLPLVARSGGHKVSHRREFGRAPQPGRDRLEAAEQVVEVVGDQPLAVLGRRG